MKNVKFRGRIMKNSAASTRILQLGSKFRGSQKTVGPSNNHLHI